MKRKKIVVAKKPIKKKIIKIAIKKVAKKNIKKSAPKKTISKKADSKKKGKTKIAKKKIKSAAKKLAAPKLVTLKKSLKLETNYSEIINPLGERILVKLVQIEKITAGGLIIPESVDLKSSYLKAIVMAVGKGQKTKKGILKPLDVKVGDTVLFQRHVSVKIEFKSEELYILNESNVLGIA